jgi:hypothetical protein
LGTALTCFSLGDTVEPSRGYLLDYYAPTGDATAAMIAANAHRVQRRDRWRGRDLRGRRRRQADPRPTVADPDQSDADGDGQAPTTVSSVRL